MSTRKAKFAAAYIVLSLLKKKKSKNKRRIWTREWILRRQELDIHNSLLSELRLQDIQHLDNFLRMTAEDFEYLLQLVGPRIAKNDTNMRQSIPPSERLWVTLRFLGTGDSYHSLMDLFRIPVCTIAQIIPNCCQALFEVLKYKYLQTPKTPIEWLKHAKLFEEVWNFPHCVGALDGKHICIQASKDTSSYYNYKGFNTIILMALVDATYKFLYIDIGCNRRISDEGVFNNCSLSTAFMTNTLQLPNVLPLPGREKPMPYLMVADDAFTLKPYLLNPYPFSGQNVPTNRIFNHRILRARRVIDNVFGIIANRFRILRKTIELGPEKVIAIVSAVCVLHNFLMDRKSQFYAPLEVFDTDDTNGEWRILGMPTTNLLQLRPSISHNYSDNAKEVRDEFRDYFVSPEGEVSWQYKYI